MSELRFEISMSLDGFVAGPDQSEHDPLGRGGEQLHEWVTRLASWRERHGLEGGETDASSETVERALENVGAVLMGRNMFGGRGSWEEHPWDGWWGDDPPFHMPVFVVTHHPLHVALAGRPARGGGFLLLPQLDRRTQPAHVLALLMQ